jgi:hypothetical protein
MAVILIHAWASSAPHLACNTGVIAIVARPITRLSSACGGKANSPSSVAIWGSRQMPQCQTDRPRARHKKMEGDPGDNGDENDAFRTPK